MCYVDITGGVQGPVTVTYPFPPQNVCPNCGACPCCGRRTAPALVWPFQTVTVPTVTPYIPPGTVGVPFWMTTGGTMPIPDGNTFTIINNTGAVVSS